MGYVFAGIVAMLSLLLGVVLVAVGFVSTDFCGDKLDDNLCGYTLLVAGILLVLAWVVILWVG